MPRMLGKYDMPLLPLHSAEAIPSSLLSFFQSRLSAEEHQNTRQNLVTASSVIRPFLPYCSIKTPLSEHTINVLTDVTTGFRDLAAKAGTEEGKALLRDYLGEKDADSVAQFWTEEYTF